MVQNSKMEQYRIVKAVGNVPAGGKLQLIYELDGRIPTVYMDGGLMPEAWQVRFRNLVNKEKTNGWDCLKPLANIRDRI